MLIIFDCDGVLVDSEIIASEVNLEVLRELGIEMTMDEMSNRFAGTTPDRMFQEIAEENDKRLPDDLDDRTDRMIDERQTQRLQAVKGVHEMLDILDQSGDPRCICSNSGSDRINRNLKKTELFQRFEPHIFSAVEVGTKAPKPAPDVFLHATTKFDADPTKTFVIEDSNHGIEGAIAAGMRVIGFTGASHTYPGHAEKLMEAGALTTVNRLTDVPATIEALRNWSGLE